MKVRFTVLSLLVFATGLFIGQSCSDGNSVAALQADRFEGVAAPAAAAATTLPDGLTESERRHMQVFETASPATVFVNQVRTYRRGFFSLDSTRVQQGTGSGIVWDRLGHILTNFHVLQGSREFSVTLWDGSEWEARVVGVAQGKDLAVLKIDAPADLLEPVAKGSSADLAVGRTVLALGNPFGLDQTLTVGIVSALGRDLEAPDGRTIRDVIQTDAAINPGNSGGPLLDSRGRLVGVNTAITSPSGAYAGIGFAIPVDTVKDLVPQLIRYGEPIRPGIGVQVLPDLLARRYGFEGVVIERIVPGKPADRAGLEAVTIDRRGRWSGDVIIGVNGVRIRTLPELQDAFEAAGGVGAEVTLTLQNGNRQHDVDIDLIEVNQK